MTHTNTEGLSDAVTREDAIKFLEGACRNWSKVPRLSEEDIGDVASELLRFALSRRSASNTGGVGGEALEIADALDEFSDIDEAEGGNPHVIATEREAAKLLRILASLAAEAEPVAWKWQTNYSGDAWYYAEKVSFSPITIEQGTVKNITPLYTRSSPVSAEVTVTDDKIKAISRDMEVRNMIEHAGRGFMSGSIGDASEPEWAAKIIRTILGKVAALSSINGGRENG